MTDMSSPRPAIFLDRDGTIIEDKDYLASVDNLEIFSFSERALQLFRDAGFLIIILTNQSGIGRGYFDEATMHSIHDALDRSLSGLIDGFYFCPHSPEDGCDCRKPSTGLIRNAASDHEIDLANSWMIGDKKSDIETGFRAGISTALVMTGYGESELSKLERMPDIVAQDLLDAANQILSRDN